MPDEITPALFTHLVELAALELTPEEAAYLRRELNNQLKAIDQLAAIPLETDTEITSHGVAYTAESSPPPRPDTWQPYPNIAALLSQAPKMDEGYIVVPPIPHEELE